MAGELFGQKDLIGILAAQPIRPVNETAWIWPSAARSRSRSKPGRSRLAPLKPSSSITHSSGTLNPCSRAERVGKSIDRLNVVDLSAELIRAFLTDIEVTRGCSIASRNQRLAAVRAFAGFVGEHSPVHIEWSGQVRSIPFKKTGQTVVPYLEKAEIDALLATPDRRTEQGRRDYALLLFLYNTGARASEAVGVKVADLNLNAPSVKIHGKGGKQPYCPLWTATVVELRALVADGAPIRLPQSLRPTHHSLRDPYRRRALWPQGRRQNAVVGEKARKPSLHPPHHGDPSPARRRRHQHSPQMARARLAGHHERLCRSRLRDQG